MIKVLRIGHATFETPDLAKAIEHYTQVIGLSLAGREDKRAFLATKIGQLAIELHEAPGALHQAVVRGLADTDFADLKPRIAEARRLGRGAQRFRSRASPRCCRSRTPRAPRSSCSASGALSATASRSSAQARSSSGTSPSSRRAEAARGVLRRGAGLPHLRLDRRLLRVHALQRRPPFGEFHHRQEPQVHHIAFELMDFSHLQTACDLFGERKIPIIWGRCGSGPATTSRLFTAITTTGGRVLRRARSDEGRGARLFRSAALAPRPPATAEGLG